MKTSTLEQAESLALLRQLLPVGSTVYTDLRHVSKSGMSRDISVHIVEDGRIRDITWLVARVTGFTFKSDGGHLRVGGAGMDMGFHVVYSLSSVLYRDGHKCTGSTGYTPAGKRSKTPACPSNDHSNDYGDLSRKYDAAHPAESAASSVEPERTAYVAARQQWIREQPTYSKRRVHRDGGYALRQTWL